MNKLTTQLLSLSAVLLLFMGFTAGEALAQAYATPSGKAYVLDDCTFADPCDLAGAVEDATDGSGSTEVRVLLPNTGATVTFQEDLEGAAEIDMSMSITTELAAGSAPDINGFIAVEGDITIDTGATLTIAENVELRLVGQPGRLEMHDLSEIDGDGFVAFTATGGDHTIILGEPTAFDCLTATPPNRADIRNLRVEKTNGDVKVIDECPSDDESFLFINNRLDVDAGELDMNDNNLFFAANSEHPDMGGGRVPGDDPGVTISGGAVVSGSGTAFIMVEEPASGPDVGFANNEDDGADDGTDDDCFEIDGAGNLNMAFDKTTNAGVCIDLDEIGAGGFSFNRAGTLFVREAIQLNGSFLNESLAGDVATSGARTEFWALKTITTNLEIVGMGDETLDPHDDYIDAFEPGEECETNGISTGNESGVYFFTDVAVEGDLVMTDTDDPDTVDLNGFGEDECIEGLWFLGDADPDDSAMAKGADVADHQTFSTIEGDFTNTGTSGVYLDSDKGFESFTHNVAFEGDFIFDISGTSPTFVLESPADAFPVGDLCSAYTAEADGNKVLFTGSSDQLLKYTDTLLIEAVQIIKDDTNDDVEIRDDSGEFLIDTSLEVIRGEFITNGLLDAHDAGDNNDKFNRATVVINRDDDGSGVLEAGGSDRAYVSDDDEDTPLKVKYTGNRPHFTGDEIPGDSDGSEEGAEIRLSFLEIFTSNDNAVITLGKDFTVGDDDLTGPIEGTNESKLIITQGILDVGSSEIKLANRLRIEIGDGNISEPDQIGERGGFVFPTEWIPLDDTEGGFERDFYVGEDGIDLLYFGTSDRTVGLEWPASDTDIANRDEDPDVIRDVTINPPCRDFDAPGDPGIHDIIISLREDDNEFRINGDLIIGSEAFNDSGERADDFTPDDGNDNDDGTGLGALDIVGNVLELNAGHNFEDDPGGPDPDDNNDTFVEVHGGADLTDSTDELLGRRAEMAELTEAVQVAMAKYRQERTAEAAAEMQEQFDLLKAAQEGLSKTADHAGLIRFIGADSTHVWAGTSGGRLRFDFPAIEVDKVLNPPGDDVGRGNPRVTFNANGIFSTSTGAVAANRPDVIGTSHFTLRNGAAGDDDCWPDVPTEGCGDGGGVELMNNLDIFDVGGQYEQYAGEFLMNGLSSIGPAPVKPFIQTTMVGFRFEPGNMIIEDGEFYAGDTDPAGPGQNAGSGGNVEVFGDFCLGCTPPETSGAASKLAADPSDGVFSLAVNGTHTVVGDFTVGPDDDPAEDPADSDERNRYFLGGECGILPDKGGLFLNGNYHFEGTGDRFDDLDYLSQEQGLVGNVFFTGAVEQFVWHRQDEDAFFCDVVMASRSSDNDGIELLANAWQNDMGTLTLEHGVIDVGADSSDWIILNTGFEGDLKNRNNSARGMGVVDLGSRDSYINGEVDRRVEFGNATGGVITGGYLFPTGIVGEGRNDGPVGDRDVDFFRPLILQFPDDLGRAALARVNYVGLGDVGDTPPANAAKASTVITPDDCEWPENNLIVDAGGGETLELDVLSNQFWQVEFDRIPSFDPNVRVEADELPNVFDIKSLRLIQWDCDCTNPRLAGLYDLVGPDPVDDASSALNDFIDSVPNITQEGVDVEACQIIGIASNFLINQINQPENPFGFARVQLIHNSPNGGEVDVYVDGVRVWDDARFQTATGFLPVIGGTHTVDIVPGSAADNSNPVFSQEFSVEHNTDYIVIAHGLVGGDPGFRLVIEDNVRTEALDPDNVDFFLVHGATALGEVDIRELDAVNNNDVIGLLANNFSFDDVVRSLSLTAGVGHNIEIITSDGSDQIDVFRFELQSIAGSAVALTLTGDAAKASPGSTTALSIMGVEADGTVFFPDLITADEPDVAAELPTTFELFGNYPNPFNPSTTISFDLPQTAEVSIQIIDMLGRSVMTLPAKQMEAGAKRTVEVDASNLASGAYLYRLVAKTATETMVKTGRMMLIK